MVYKRNPCNKIFLCCSIHHFSISSWKNIENIFLRRNFSIKLCTYSHSHAWFYFLLCSFSYKFFAQIFSVSSHKKKVEKLICLFFVVSYPSCSRYFGIVCCVVHKMTDMSAWLFCWRYCNNCSFCCCLCAAAVTFLVSSLRWIDGQRNGQDEPLFSVL